MKRTATPWHQDMHTNQSKCLKVIVCLSAGSKSWNQTKQSPITPWFSLEWKSPVLQHGATVTPWYDCDCRAILNTVQGPALSGRCGNAFCYLPPTPPSSWTVEPSLLCGKRKNKHSRVFWKSGRCEAHWGTCILSLPGPHGIPSVDKHLVSMVT